MSKTPTTIEKMRRDFIREDLSKMRNTADLVYEYLCDNGGPFGEPPSDLSTTELVEIQRLSTHAVQRLIVIVQLCERVLANRR